MAKSGQGVSQSRRRLQASAILLVVGLALISATRPGKAEEIPARRLFGFVLKPAPLPPAAVGFYARGCLAGGAEMPADGPAWQVMRPSRNRNWGHPRLVAFLKDLALKAQKEDGWPGLLIGDMSQPRGGPMLTGHRSHQSGLDADVWMMPMPSRRLTRREREETSAISMLGPDRLHVDPKRFRPGHVKLLKRAASDPRVARIFVHPGIKAALCDATKHETNRGPWMRKIRAWWGHHYHFHVRLKCPPGNTLCKDQKPVPAADGCGDSLKAWFRRLTEPPKPRPKKKKVKKKPPLTLARLPAACRKVLTAGAPHMLAQLTTPVSGKVPLPEPKKK